jgi:DNA replication protein DnaC
MVELTIDAALPEFLRVIAQRHLAGDAPVYCGACTSERDELEDAKEEQARRLLVLSERLRRSGIPPKWQGQTFEALDADTPRLRALQRAREWAAGEVRGLVLWGPVGRGKTAIAAAAANERMAHGDVRWLPVAELLMALSSPFGSKTREDAAARLDAARGRAALVLDDLDKLKPSEHAVMPLYVAINAWIEAGLPLLITLNRDLDALMAWLPETFAEALSSRLSGYCKVQQVGGNDRRLR